MRYYFDYKDHISITDGQGVECRTLEDAREHAKELAEQFARTAPSEVMQTHVVVVDNTGREVFRTPIPYGQPNAQVDERDAGSTEKELRSSPRH